MPVNLGYHVGKCLIAMLRGEQPDWAECIVPEKKAPEQSSEEDKQLGAELDSFNVNAAKAAVSV